MKRNGGFIKNRPLDFFFCLLLPLTCPMHCPLPPVNSLERFVFREAFNHDYHHSTAIFVGNYNRNQTKHHALLFLAKYNASASSVDVFIRP